MFKNVFITLCFVLVVNPIFANSDKKFWAICPVKSMNLSEVENKELTGLEKQFLEKRFSNRLSKIVNPIEFYMFESTPDYQLWKTSVLKNKNKFWMFFKITSLETAQILSLKVLSHETLAGLFKDYFDFVESFKSPIHDKEISKETGMPEDIKTSFAMDFDIDGASQTSELNFFIMINQFNEKVINAEPCIAFLERSNFMEILGIQNAFSDRIKNGNYFQAYYQFKCKFFLKGNIPFIKYSVISSESGEVIFDGIISETEFLDGRFIFNIFYELKLIKKKTHEYSLHPHAEEITDPLTGEKSISFNPDKSKDICPVCEKKCGGKCLDSMKISDEKK